MPVVDVIGATAHRAVIGAGGRAQVLARTTTAFWLRAGDEIVWLGGGRMPHPRAMLTAAAVDGERDVVELDVGSARVWRSTALALDDTRIATLQRGAASLRASLRSLGEPDGLARLLLDDAPQSSGVLTDVLARAAPRVAALAAACRADRADDAVEPAIALLGLGPGLTPAGDDFVGGVLFACRLVATTAWRRTAEAVLRAAPARTHPISVALIGDLAAGESHAALHEIVEALAAGRDPRDPVRRLTRIGHSSGWDILAGLLSGLGA